ncbi:MAG: DUF1127 domain-containing protein [Alphaproteobacteria bacterium]
MFKFNGSVPAVPSGARPYRPALQDLARSATELVVRALEWQDRARQRNALLELGDHLLKDIGVSPAEAHREGHKPFWRA